ncbi:HD domain-containing protein, partial [Candidatus Micrarchaeota archaeon]|nr:HD domain-containing protein [Candidatus Micrarchaeota archaeon]
MNSEYEYGPIVKYIFEAGMLKRVARSGWWTEKIKNPETVAEHTFRAALIAFILAKMEGADAHKLASAAVFHDMHETRL